ncbi:MAG: PD-(D/E)XK nuclease family protein [Thermofilaceae archaeon]
MQQLEELLRERLNELVKKTSHRLRLSSIGECPRRQWWEARELEEEEPPEELKGVYIAGLVWEKAILDLLGVPPEARQVEVTVEGIKGHIDGILTIDDTPIIVEVKTTSSQLIDNTPQHNHVWQAYAYAVGYKEAHGVEPSIAIIYIARENPTLLRVWEGKYSEEWERRIKEVACMLVSDEVPPVPASFAPYKLPCEGVTYGQYTRCPYHERCWQGELVLAKTYAIDVAEKTAIDELGEQHEMLKAMQRDSLEQRLKEAIRKCFEEHPEVEEVMIEGIEWRLVGRRRVRRLLNIKKAEELLAELGVDVEELREPKEEVYVTWTRIKSDKRR